MAIDTKVIALDPGVTTGVVVAKLLYKDNDRDFKKPTGYVIDDQFEMVFTDRFPKLHQLFHKEYSGDIPVEAVIIESFHLRPTRDVARGDEQVCAIRMIGAIEALAYHNGLASAVLFQTPNQGKSAKPPEQLLGYSSKHIKDAGRHMRYYYIMRVKGKQPTVSPVNRLRVWYE